LAENNSRSIGGIAANAQTIIRIGINERRMAETGQLATGLRLTSQASANSSLPRPLFLESDGPLTIATVHGVVFHFFGAPNRRLEQEQN
jgi:hypothetical protein